MMLSMALPINGCTIITDRKQIARVRLPSGISAALPHCRVDFHIAALQSSALP
jgi:hypothetical protein